MALCSTLVVLPPPNNILLAKFQKLLLIKKSFLV